MPKFEYRYSMCLPGILSELRYLYFMPCLTGPGLSSPVWVACTFLPASTGYPCGCFSTSSPVRFVSCVSTTTCLPARSMTGRLRSSPCRYFPPAHRFPGFGQRQQMELGKHKEVKLTKLYQSDFSSPNLTSLSFFPYSLVFILFLCPVSSHPQHTRPGTIGSLFENL